MSFLLDEPKKTKSEDATTQRGKSVNRSTRISNTNYAEIQQYKQALDLAWMFAQKYAQGKKRWNNPKNQEVDNIEFQKLRKLMEELK